MTEDEEETAQERKWEEAARLRSERHSYVPPNCCEAMKRCKSIVISVSGTPGDVPHWWLRLRSNFADRGLVDEYLVAAERAWDEEFRKKFAEKFAVKPNTWTDEDAANYKANYKPFYPNPTHCPYCGTELPAIVKKAEVPSPLHVGEDYCDTCGERAMNCACWPPWAAYESATTTLYRGPEEIAARIHQLDGLVAKLDEELRILRRTVRS